MTPHLGGVRQISTIGQVSEDLAHAEAGYVDLPGLRVHFQRWRPAGQTPGVRPSIVLVHGLGSSCHIWDLVAPQLAAADEYNVVALDQRGHGLSDQPETGYDFASIVADLEHFIAAEATGVAGPAVLVGHSWGASVVLHFAVVHPERTAGIVLLDGGTASPGERWSWEETLARLTPPDIDGMLWTELRQRMGQRNGALADPRVEAVSRSLFEIDANGRIRRRFRIPNHLKIVRALWEQRPAELLPQVRCPMLVLPARQASDAPEWRSSKADAVARLAQLQPRARVRWFEDTIHDVPLQRPDELAAELLAFARDVVPAQVPGHAST
jgi:pimeloyl-ACP methyl ester carboxylesterase